MEKGYEYTAIVVRWFDRVNGNTYHSVRVIRNADRRVVYASMCYGYGSAYEISAVEAMARAGWIQDKYLKEAYRFQMDNGYPILFMVREGTKRECIDNGKEG